MMRNRRGGRRWFAAARWTVLGMALMSVAAPVAAQDEDELPAGPGRDHQFIPLFCILLYRKSKELYKHYYIHLFAN